MVVVVEAMVVLEASGGGNVLGVSVDWWVGGPNGTMYVQYVTLWSGRRSRMVLVSLCWRDSESAYSL
jgi:hypothetical protein